MAVPTPLAADLLLFDRYRLKSPLGRERTGHCWLANDERLNMEVAVTVFDAHPAPSVLERGVNDCKNISHPNLVRAYEFAGDSVRCAVVMEYLEGKSIRALLRNRSNSCFDVLEIRRWTEQLLCAINVVHKRGKVHGNLNLENLFINDRNDLKVLDLGLQEGRMLSRNAERAFTVPSCLSPQVLNDEKIQPSDDLYAIGACVYEMLTGQPLFSGGNLAMQIASKQPALVSERRAELGVHGDAIPPEWDEWINSCLAKERRDRPKTADGIVEIVRQTAGATSRSVVAETPTQVKLPALAAPSAPITTPATMVTTAEGISLPFVFSPLPARARSSPWGKIAVAAVLLIGGLVFYFSSWKPSQQQIRQMEIDFQKVRRADNEAPQEIAAQREVAGVLRDFVDKYTGLDIPYTDRDDLIRSQAEQRYDDCMKRIRDLQDKLAAAKNEEQDKRQKNLKAAFDKATEVAANPLVSAHAKLVKWQSVLESFGDHDASDEPLYARLIVETRTNIEKYTAEEKKEAEQLNLYTDELQIIVNKANALKNDASLTPGMRWAAMSDLHPVAIKPPGEQKGEHEALERTQQQYRTEFEEAAHKVPQETLQSVFARTSFAKATDDKKSGLLLAVQDALKDQGLLKMEEPDGQPGEATQTAVAEFQHKNNMPVNAGLDDATLWMLGFGDLDTASLPSHETVAETTPADSPPATPEKGSQKSRKSRSSSGPPKSKYDSAVGAARLARDKLFNRVNATEYRKHVAYEAWRKKNEH